MSSNAVVEVQVRALAAADGGCAVFLGNAEKVFLILVDQSVGVAIALAIQGTPTERPLTHELVATVLRALGAKLERVVINNFEHDTFFATLVVTAENELLRKRLLELDARPSDCIALAARQGAPIYVDRDVWNQVEDVSDELRKLRSEGASGPGEWNEPDDAP
ncbi:MAG: bifunctional nuclease family protein [Verrucomicrobia bacterium]|nr:bifunctional nuclease family protein [Verrucomicrobiota bacterium]